MSSGSCILDNEVTGQHTEPSVRCDNQIQDPAINVEDMIKLGINLDIEVGKDPSTLREVQRLGTVLWANEPMVASITQQKKGHSDQYYQYHSHFGNDSKLATLKANSPCYHHTMKSSFFHASPKQCSGISCSIVTMPITVSPTLSSRNNQTSLLKVHSDLALPDSDPNVVTIEHHNVKALGYQGKGIKMDIELTVNSHLHSQERSPHFRFKEQI
ncbi:hypothetical protein EDD85DRAFT_796822 [Armillaria nabsnona]|nr:hypothetical protein EDD85DRAFT_796822 [Armillaria nabsnona]